MKDHTKQVFPSSFNREHTEVGESSMCDCCVFTEYATNDMYKVKQQLRVPCGQHGNKLRVGLQMMADGVLADD